MCFESTTNKCSGCIYVGGHWQEVKERGEHWGEHVGVGSILGETARMDLGV